MFRYLSWEMVGIICGIFRVYINVRGWFRFQGQTLDKFVWFLSKKKQRLSRTTSPELKRQFKWKQLRTTYPRRKGRISWKSRKATLGSGMACATAWTASAAACARCRATASVESSEACQH